MPKLGDKSFRRCKICDFNIRSVYKEIPFYYDSFEKDWGFEEDWEEDSHELKDCIKFLNDRLSRLENKDGPIA